MKVLARHRGLWSTFTVFTVNVADKCDHYGKGKD
jgi:hypothetical protein